MSDIRISDLPLTLHMPDPGADTVAAALADYATDLQRQDQELAHHLPGAVDRRERIREVDQLRDRILSADVGPVEIGRRELTFISDALHFAAEGQQRPTPIR